MKDIVIHCNRCGEKCMAHFSGLEISFGDLLSHFDDAELHLCRACGDSFLSWLRAGNTRFRADMAPIRKRDGGTQR